MPLSRVPREVLNESRIVDPVKMRFFARYRRVPGYFESGARAFLGEDSHRAIV
jgi:hypothetical protein